MIAFAKQSLAGLRVLLTMTVLLGVLYPLAAYGIGRLVPEKADGSMIEIDGQIVGSRLLGQVFDGDEWFHPRPSAAGDGYDPMSSGASNLGPENTELLAEVEQRRAAVAQREDVRPEDVPADAVTASGSGLDPHVSPAYAAIQVARVAAVRDLDPEVVRSLVAAATTDRELGFLGDPRVNVVELNAALAAQG